MDQNSMIIAYISYRTIKSFSDIFRFFICKLSLARCLLAKPALKSQKSKVKNFYFFNELSITGFSIAQLKQPNVVPTYSKTAVVLKILIKHHQPSAHSFLTPDSKVVDNLQLIWQSVRSKTKAADWDSRYVIFGTTKTLTQIRSNPFLLFLDEDHP